MTTAASAVAAAPLGGAALSDGGYGDEVELGNLNPASWLVCYYSDWYRVTVELPLLLHIQFFSLGITRDRAKRLTRDTVQKMDSTNDLSNT